MRRILTATIAVLVLTACGDAGSEDGRLCARTEGVCASVEQKNGAHESPELLTWTVDCEYDRNEDVRTIGHACDSEPAQDRCIWEAMEVQDYDRMRAGQDVAAYCRCVSDVQLDEYKAEACPNG